VKAKNLILFQVILLSILTFNCRLNAQINIFPGPDVTPYDMVECIVGEGVTFDNVTFQGADVSRGIFTNGSATNLGIESGIFLTSGAGYIIPGPNSSYMATVNNSMPGHPSLNGITTYPTYDAAVLEFDFVPESDTLRFKYVFGSEEYDEWVDTPFNDVFGYFVSGPDPMGGFYSDKNIAIIPGTVNTSVCINNVNNGYSFPGVVPTGPCMNCQYYSANTYGVTLEYDGFTVVLIAWVQVVPCETYHIKIGVADAGDAIYDSGVFIEENSFESPKIEVEMEPIPQGVAENMIEGCVEADIIFKLPNSSYAPITVYFEVTGSATNGVDYEEIPDHITFEEGEDTAYIHVIPFKDDIIEGEENIMIIIENTLGCIVRYDTVEFIIIDYIKMVTTPSPNTMICEGQEVEIWVTTENGIPPYTYEWLDLPFTNDTITVSPEATTTYVVNVTDMCLDTISDSVQVMVFPSPDIDLGPDSVLICMGDTLILNAGGGYLAYLWQDGSTDSTYTVTGTGNYLVLVTGPGGCTGSDEVFVEVSEVYVNLGPDTTICIGDTLILNAGSGYSSYLWQDNSTGQTYIATETGYYWVEVTNQDACTAIDSLYLFVDDAVTSLELGDDIKVCTGEEVVLEPQFGVYYSYLWSTGETTSSITVIEPGTYTLEVGSGCGTAYDTITVDNWPIPDPDLGADTNLCYGGSVLLEAAYGFESYEWQDGSILSFFNVTQSGIYYVDIVDYNGCEGSDTVYVEVADIVDLGEDSLILCEGNSITLDAGNSFDFYTWSTGEYGVSSIEVESGGWYKVSVNYYFGCPSEDSVLIEELPMPVAEITGDNSFCEGETILLSAPEGKFDYYWNEVQGEQTYTVTQGGNYELLLKNYCGEDTDEKFVEQYLLPEVDLGENKILFPGESVTLDAGDFVSYVWDHGWDQRYYQVKFEDIDENDTIYVEVFDGHCKNSDYIIIEVFNVEIPIVITPNGDNFNDRFEPKEEGWNGINNHKMLVYNRWGEKVWESSDFPGGWDGKRNGRYVAEGTYFWVLEVYYGPKSLKKVYKGSLTILDTN